MNETCIFCTKILPEQVLTETENFKVVFDINPVQMGHLLIISKKHYMDIRECSREILLDLVNLEKKLVEKIYEVFDVDGVTIIENNGAIMDKGTHLHVHIIPRWKNDKFWDNQLIVVHKNDIKKLKQSLSDE
ncbi:MAG: HIT family protein [Streptococcaceae bacterium]|nr:HIT family protein [Streptococcaceae bacterium]